MLMGGYLWFIWAVAWYLIRTANGHSGADVRWGVCVCVCVCVCLRRQVVALVNQIATNFNWKRTQRAEALAQIEQALL